MLSTIGQKAISHQQDQQAIAELEQLPSILSGETIAPNEAHTSLFVHRFEQLLTNCLESELLYVLHQDFRSTASIQVRAACFIRNVAQQLHDHGNISLDFLVNRLIVESVLMQRPHPKNVSFIATATVFNIVGWLSLLWSAKQQAHLGSLAVEPFESTSLLVSSLPFNFANRSLFEILSNFGDVLPLPDSQNRYKGLKVATLNFATLQNVGKLRIKWIDSFCGHLEFDAALSTIYLFRFPTILALQTSQNSSLSRIVQRYYNETRDPGSKFTVAALSREVMLSYALLFRYDSNARRLYRTQERNAAAVHGHLDPILDELCLGPGKIHLLTRRPVKESFDAGSDFPILTHRLIRIQEHIDAVQPNRITSLWRDRRDISRWYTFWAVIILGGANLLIACLQAAMAAAQVVLAKKALIAQLDSNQASSPSRA